jgi:hypothetical protein
VTSKERKSIPLRTKPFRQLFNLQMSFLLATWKRLGNQTTHTTRAGKITSINISLNFPSIEEERRRKNRDIESPTAAEEQISTQN